MNKINPTFLKLFSLLVLLVVISNCEYERQNNVGNYHLLVNKAELAICQEKHDVALENYGLAFRQISRPFGKDLYNAALSAHVAGNKGEREAYLQQLIDGSEEIGFIKSSFIKNGMTVQEWEVLENERKQDYDAALRSEMGEIRDRDQLFRPDYENYGDTINALRVMNLHRLLELSASRCLPSHIEIGFPEGLSSQPHHIVLQHTAQRRSYDKSVIDLEPLLSASVDHGLIDPEQAILYLKLQNDAEKGRYDNYSTWQYRHPLLPDSMNKAIWVSKLSASNRDEINEIRRRWKADSVEDIAIKSAYLSKTDWPFIFTSVDKSITLISENISAAEAVEQYLHVTDGLEIMNQ